MESLRFQRKGIGKQIALFSLDAGKNYGNHVLLFNLILETNERAIHLWKQLVLSIIAEIQEAFQHLEKVLVSAYIFYKNYEKAATKSWPLLLFLKLQKCTYFRL